MAKEQGTPFPGLFAAAKARLGLLVLFCGFQYWLLTAAIEAYHSGNRAVPAFSFGVSVLCFLLAAGLMLTGEWTWNRLTGSTVSVAARAGRPMGIQGRGRWVSEWNPEDPVFWESCGKAVARQNLWISIPALLLAFAVWMVWSTIVVELPNIGFKFTTDQLFWLAALPGLSGATLRIFYSFMVPIVGGRNWTAMTTLSLLLPAAGIGLAVQNPETPYSVFLALALLSGFGGGNFASSMSNISFFFPKAQKGTALGLNGGLGNLGVSAVQFMAPAVISAGLFGSWGGGSQHWNSGSLSREVWLQNAAFFWIPLILVVSLAAWFGMHNLSAAKSSFKDQAVIFRRKHNWLTCVLYTGTFGSFIGYSAGLALLIKTQFPGVNPLQYAFIGPLVGALARSAGGWLADRFGGARITFWNFLLMIAATSVVLLFLENKDLPHAFGGFLAASTTLFFAAGIGNGSVYRMVPSIFLLEKKKEALLTNLSDAEVQRDAAKESAAVLGFISAIAAYGAFIVPKSFGWSVKQFGAATGALYIFIAYYALCLCITWWFYYRREESES